MREEALAMEQIDPELHEEIKKLYNGMYVKRGFWGPKKYYLNENYRTIAEDIYRMSLRPDDVFVSSCLRSGTTWTQELVWLVVNDINIEEAKSVPLNKRYTFLEYFNFLNSTIQENVKQQMLKDPNSNSNAIEMLTLTGPELLARKECPRFVKTHLPLSLLPPNLLQEAKIVYVARDPRDVMVSFYHFVKGFKSNEFIGDLKQFVDLFVRGLVHCSPYFEHVKEAWRLRHDPNLLFLFYEDMCKDVHGCIRKIAEFFGKSYTDEQIARIAEHTRFDNFKQNESVDEFKDFKDVVYKNEAKFVRQGKSGGWRESFDAETIEKVNKWMRENLKDTDLVFHSD